MIRILIADDHFIFRKGMKDLLCDNYPAIHTDEAEDTTVLLEKTSAFKWDLIISDINMPGAGGLDALTKIRHSFPKLPVLMFSMHNEKEYALRIIKAGASGYLNKNAGPDEVIKAVQNLLAGKKYFSPAVIELIAATVSSKTPTCRHESLSSREFDVLKHFASGKEVGKIAETLLVSPNTVSTYKARIMKKIGLTTNSQLIRYALDNHLVA